MFSFERDLWGNDQQSHISQMYDRHWRYKDGQDLILAPWLILQGEMDMQADECREGWGNCEGFPMSGVGYAILSRVFTEHLTHCVLGFCFVLFVFRS